MSGGSFEYVCYKAQDDTVFQATEQLQEMATYLRQVNKPDIASEIEAFTNYILEMKEAAIKRGMQISDLLKAVEWWASGDWSESSVDTAWQEYQQKDKSVISS